MFRNPIIEEIYQRAMQRKRERTERNRRKCSPALVEVIKDAIGLAIEKGYEALYPWQVQAFLPISMHESTVRRYMAHMANEGQLVRLGQRKGYVIHNAG